MPEPIELRSIRLENVRNFSDATLHLDRPRLVLVGRNNAGKTGVLRVLDWLLNDLDTDELYELKHAQWDCQDVVTPARETGNRARRITLNIRIHDGRFRRGYDTDDDNLVSVRLKVGPVSDFKLSAKLGAPVRSEGWESDHKAVQLLERLQETYMTRYIPSFRDVRSTRFSQSLRDAFSEALEERTSKTGKKGPQYREYKQVSAMGKELRTMAETLTRPVLDQLMSSAPKGLLQEIDLSMDITPATIVSWLVDQVDLRLKTGQHDRSSVAALSVGSGLQSVLDVALHAAIAEEAGCRALLMIEEPEAFLHPSAQRQIARRLLGSEGVPGQLIVTTHSPAVVEEAGFAPLCLAQDQRFHVHDVAEPRRAAINTQLLRASGSEMIFASAVLLVEGPGDQQFYEALRRRLAALDPSGRMDQLFVVSVGGSNRFCPWIKLARAFGPEDGPSPIRTLVVMDADRADDMRTVAAEVRSSSMKSMRDRIGAVAEALAAIGDGKGQQERVAVWHTAARAASAAFEAQGYPIAYHDGDLEYASLQSVHPDALAALQTLAGTEVDSRADFIRKLGSKGITGKKTQDGLKGPHIRGAIGAALPRTSLSPTTRMILRRWMVPTIPEADAEALLDGDW